MACQQHPHATHELNLQDTRPCCGGPVLRTPAAKDPSLGVRARGRSVVDCAHGSAAPGKKLGEAGFGGTSWDVLAGRLASSTLCVQCVCRSRLDGQVGGQRGGRVPKYRWGRSGALDDRTRARQRKPTAEERPEQQPLLASATISARAGTSIAHGRAISASNSARVTLLVIRPAVPNVQTSAARDVQPEHGRSAHCPRATAPVNPHRRSPPSSPNSSSAGSGVLRLPSTTAARTGLPRRSRCRDRGLV
jgi:hypothetical protein